MAYERPNLAYDYQDSAQSRKYPSLHSSSLSLFPRPSENSKLVIWNRKTEAAVRPSSVLVPRVRAAAKAPGKQTTWTNCERCGKIPCQLNSPDAIFSALSALSPHLSRSAFPRIVFKRGHSMHSPPALHTRHSPHHADPPANFCD